jgi:hypothetical protein
MRQSVQVALIGLACGFLFIFGVSQWQEPAPKVRSAQLTQGEQLILSRINALSGRLDTLGEIDNSTSLLAARLSKDSSLSSSVASNVLPSLPAEPSPSALPSMEVLLTWRMEDWITYLARRKAAKGERATMLQASTPKLLAHYTRSISLHCTTTWCPHLITLHKQYSYTVLTLNLTELY